MNKIFIYGAGILTGVIITSLHFDQNPWNTSVELGSEAAGKVAPVFGKVKDKIFNKENDINVEIVEEEED